MVVKVERWKDLNGNLHMTYEEAKLSDIEYEMNQDIYTVNCDFGGHAINFQRVLSLVKKNPQLMRDLVDLVES
jgi:hypothetical protein